MKLEEVRYVGGEPVVLVYSDSEGWPVYENFQNIGEAMAFIEENIPQEDDYNPAPLLINRTLNVEELDGYRYS